MTKPPFQITTNILNAAMRVSILIGELQGLQISRPKTTLRKENRIKTIHASLAIEGNTLSVAQITNILEGVPVIGPPKDLLEVQNAIKVYEQFVTFKFSSERHFKQAHKIMMDNLASDAGDYRTGNVGVFDGTKIKHVAPQPKMVSQLMRDLFLFLNKKDDISLLIKACVFHYELEFIHPFNDGNGRMGRLWQQVILTNYHEIFQYIAIETLVKEQQKKYYKVLAKCDQAGESTAFVEFCLSLIEQALDKYLNQMVYIPKTSLERLDYAKSQIAGKFSRKTYLDVFKNISSATASRDLKLGVEQKLVIKSGDKNVTLYEFNGQSPGVRASSRL